MKYKYQLILLGSDVSIRGELESLFLLKLKELQLPEGIVKIISNKDFYSEYSGNQPAFAFYFGDTNGNFNDVDLAEKLVKDGTMILPIYFTKDAFSNEIPSILSNQNGIFYKEAENHRIIDTALEAFELLRKTRKVFISYKRTESTKVAIQLFEELEANNFDVFLDTHSIAKGEAFQDELWHRMTDCDVIVLLNTSGFDESRWCKEEFAEAGARQIGIVQLVWPDTDPKVDPMAQLTYPRKLKNDEFIGESAKIANEKDSALIKKQIVEEIIKEVESVRARNLAARQDNLITEFRNIAEECKRTITVQPERFLTENLPNGKRIIYIPTIGVPQSTSCQSAEIKKQLLGYKKVAIRLIYDDLRIRDKWINHLDWLNRNFRKDIKTLKKQEFRSWLLQN